MSKQMITSLIVGAAVLVIASSQDVVEPEKCIDDTPETQRSCPANEVYSTCRMALCRPLNCKDIGQPIMCPMIVGCCKDRGCVCIDSYARSDNGTCVPIEDCPCNGDPNAVQGCGNHCGKSCSDYDSDVECKKTFCQLNGCDCREGYVYDEVIKRCVVPEKCTPKCPANEFFTNCKIGQCRAHNCSQLGRPIACAGIIPPCNDPACVCDYDYARHDNGTCIPVDECSSCNGDPNAESGCSNYCGNSCDDYNETVACPKICKLNGCKCKPGYVYNKEIDRCVLPKDCQCKKRNEVFYDCIPFCPPEGCDTSNRAYRCAAPPKPGDKDCKPGCKCKGGFFRNKAGECIAKDDCEINKCNKENEEYYICSEEEIKADNCENSCRCVKGYVRNKDGDCVSEDSQCKENEIFVKCATHCGEGCGVDPRLIKCATYKPDSPDCPPSGCVCKPGYCRDGEGNCVKNKKIIIPPKEITPLPEPVEEAEER